MNDFQPGKVQASLGYPRWMNLITHTLDKPVKSVLQGRMLENLKKSNLCQKANKFQGENSL